MLLDKGVAVPGFVIRGECDDALATLKSTLKAQGATFDAVLQSQFKSPAAPPRQAKPAPAPQKPAAAYVATGHATTGSMTASMLSRRDADDSVRGRLRTALRSSQR